MADDGSNLTADIARLTPREARLRIEARIEVLRTQRAFFLAVGMDSAADHCEQAAVGWEGSLADLARTVDHSSRPGGEG